MLLDTEIKAIIKKYSLTQDEFYKHSDNQKILVSARGIRKIITKEEYNVSKRIEFDPQGGVAVIARVETGTSFEKAYSFYEAIGEAKLGLNTTFKFPISVAEARANSRAVLMAAELYERGVIGEAELDQETEGEAIIAKRRGQVANATDDLLSKINKK